MEGEELDKSFTKSLNLKEKFLEFKKKKQETLKFQKHLKNLTKIERTIDYKNDLRAKFIETAKKYIGTPYGKRFHNPGDKYYDAPLFLDCCALVRQVVFDLKDEFGFTLGRWNQAYQFDTLPISLKFEELKPGDLVFYSGIYHNEKAP